MENKRVSIINGEAVPFNGTGRNTFLKAGTYVVIAYGRTNLRPDGKGERIARLMHDSTSDVLTVFEWVLSSRRWRKTFTRIHREGVVRVATDADVARFQPGIKGKKKSLGW